MKDWLLLLVSIDIVMIDVVFVGPLLVLNYVYGDTWYEPDYESPPSANVCDLFSLHNRGEPKEAPHKSHIQENRCTYVCMYACVYVVICRPRAHHVCVYRACV